MAAPAHADVSLDDLWNLPAAPQARFDPHLVAGLPAAARRYVLHAIAPGTPLASAVRLRMHGTIKIGGWMPFRSEQVIRTGGNMLWTATVTPFAVPLFRGFDRLVDRSGAMRWKLFGLVPFVVASGEDITRSTAGRVQAESVWLPSWLCTKATRWADSPSGAVATLTVADHTAQIDLTVDADGRLARVKVPRWGNPPPDTSAFRTVEFGAEIDEERAFDGYTVPSRVRAGYGVGSPRFDADGAFLRATVDEAAFR